MDVGADATGAGLGGEGLGVIVVVHARSTNITLVVGAGVASEAVLTTELLVGAGADVGVTDEHAEAGLEGRDAAGLGRNVVDQNTAVDLG